MNLFSFRHFTNLQYLLFFQNCNYILFNWPNQTMEEDKGVYEPAKGLRNDGEHQLMFESALEKVKKCFYKQVRESILPNFFSS